MNIKSFIYIFLLIDLSIIAQIESSNNPSAYNPKSQARGLYQITPICLKDYNNENNAYVELQALFEPEISHGVAKWYLNQRIPQFLKNKGIPITLANVLWCYNAGIGNLLKGDMPQETKEYIRRYNELHSKRCTSPTQRD